MTIGDKLKQARQESGHSLKDVQDSIKIRTKYLKALEEETYDIIPGEAYVRAFLKGYANFLRLDSEKLIDEYQTFKENKKIEESKELKESSGKGENRLFHNKAFNLIVAIIVLVVISFVIYNIFLLNRAQDNTDNILNTLPDIEISQMSQTNEEGIELDQNEVVTIGNNYENPSSQEEEYVNTEDVISESNQASENNQHIPVNIKSVELDTNPDAYKNDVVEDKDGNDFLNKSKDIQTEFIEIIATERSWIQVIIDGALVFEGLLEEGQNKEYIAANKVFLKIGNAAGIQLKKGGETIGPWGEKGEVVRKEFKFN